jgi:hypothetical protein
MNGKDSATSLRAWLAFAVNATQYSSGDALKKARTRSRVRSTSPVETSDVGLAEWGLLRLGVEAGARVVEVHVAPGVEPRELRGPEVVDGPRPLVAGPIGEELAELIGHGVGHRAITARDAAISVTAAMAASMWASVLKGPIPNRTPP